MRISEGEPLYTSTEVLQMLRKDAEEIVARGIQTGPEFKLVRKIAKLRGIDVAKLFGVRPETVSRWETNQQTIPRTAAFALGQLLHRPKPVRRQLEAMEADAQRTTEELSNSLGVGVTRKSGSARSKRG